METKTAAIEMRNITKRFGPVLANDKVWLNIYRGEILALLEMQHAHAQQRRHHELVADHRRQRHRGDDDHAGRGREAADVGEHREQAIAVGQRQPQHVGVGVDLMALRRQRACPRGLPTTV